MARKPKQTKQTQEEVELTQAVDSVQPDDVAAYAAEYRSRCGGTLRMHREKMGLTTQEIASRLRLSVKQIEALEADNFAVLPEAAIVKGFIRNYAKQLKISSEPLLDAYNVIVPNQSPQALTLQPSASVQVHAYEKPDPVRRILLLALLLLLFGTWLFYQSYVQKPSPVAPSASEVTVAEEPLPEAALPAAERQTDTTVALSLPGQPSATPAAETAAPASQPTAPSTAPLAPQPPAVVTPPVAEATPSPASVPTNVSEPAAPAPAPAPVAEVAPAPSATEAGTRLEFTATQETWISVVDANGREIYNRTLFPGNRESIQAKPPLNVVVGNAHGATMTVNGKVQDLAPYTRINVARIKVE